MRFLVYSAVVGLLLGLGFQWVPLMWGNRAMGVGGVEGMRFADVRSFSEMVRFRVNASRQVEGLAAVEADAGIEKWVESHLPEILVHRSDAMDAVLTGLQESMPAVHTAAAYMTLAGDEHDLGRQIEEWHAGVGVKATHLVTVPFQHEESGRLGCLAVSIRKLPVFSPRLLDQQVELFLNACPHCGASHAGRVPPSGRSLVFACPHCDLPFDAYAIDNDGHYARVTNFLSRLQGPALDPPPATPLEEMYCVWYAVATRCQYATDLGSIDGPRDYWQNSMETFNLRNGDCEDTSILLADWLISRGIEARVATGKTAEGEGHAWCVARVDGVQYILETTALPDPEQPPLVSEMQGAYKPHYLFDRQGIYFLREERRSGAVADYWADEAWLAVTESAEALYERQQVLASGRPLPAPGAGPAGDGGEGEAGAAGDEPGR